MEMRQDSAEVSHSKLLDRHPTDSLPAGTEDPLSMSIFARPYRPPQAGAAYLGRARPGSDVVVLEQVLGALGGIDIAGIDDRLVGQMLIALHLPAFAHRR